MNEKESRFRLGSSHLRRSFEKEEREKRQVSYNREAISVDLIRFLLEMSRTLPRGTIPRIRYPPLGFCKEQAISVYAR